MSFAQQRCSLFAIDRHAVGAVAVLVVAELPWPWCGRHEDESHFLWWELPFRISKRDHTQTFLLPTTDKSHLGSLTRPQLLHEISSGGGGESATATGSPGPWPGCATTRYTNRAPAPRSKRKSGKSIF